jgi:hypothetical protein
VLLKLNILLLLVEAQAVKITVVAAALEDSVLLQDWLLQRVQHTQLL